MVFTVIGFISVLCFALVVTYVGFEANRFNLALSGRLHLTAIVWFVVGLVLLATLWVYSPFNITLSAA